MKNNFNIGAKDDASYSLLVKGRVANGDWSGAVGALKSMTEAGIYPVNRDLNSWNESAQRSKGRLSSWKKKRDVWVRHAKQEK